MVKVKVLKDFIADPYGSVVRGSVLSCDQVFADHLSQIGVGEIINKMQSQPVKKKAPEIKPPKKAKRLSVSQQGRASRKKTVT